MAASFERLAFAVLLAFLPSTRSQGDIITPCATGNAEINTRQPNVVPNGTAYDGIMFDVRVKEGTYGITLGDIGAWTTTATAGAEVHVYYTEDGVSYQDAGLTEANWIQAWPDASTISVIIDSANSPGAFPVGIYYDIEIMDRRGILVAFVGDAADPNIISNEIGNAPQVSQEDDHVEIFGLQGYTHPFAALSANFFEYSGPLCYDEIPFPPTNPPTLIPSPMPTSMPTPSPTSAPTPIATSAPTPEPTEPSPQVEELAFSPSGAAIHIDFSQDTSRNGAPLLETVACEDYFTSGTLARLGAAPRCRWDSSRRLTVTLGLGATVVWFDEANADNADAEILFAPNLVVADAVNTQNVFDHLGPQFFVAFPADPSLPTANLQVPSAVGPCASLLLDARASSGFVGRPPSADAFTYRSSCAVLPSVSGDPNSARVAEIVSAASTWEVAGDSIPAGDTCVFTVQVRNFLGVDSLPADDEEVLQSAEPVPSVLVRGPSNGVWVRPEPLQLSADIEFSSCPDADEQPATAAPPLAFEWTLRNTATLAVVALENSQNADLVVPGFSMEVGESYEIRVDVSVVASPDSADAVPPTNAAAFVTIERSELVASISGASSRHLSRTVDLMLDASESFDPDFPADADAADPGAQQLQFEWTCETAGARPASCDLPESVDLLSPTLAIPQGDLPAANDLRFAVRVAASDGVFASDEVLVTLVDEPIPLVVITGAVEIDSEQTLRLEGTAQVSEGAEQFLYSWREVSDLIDFDSVLVETSQDARNLVIEPGLLEPFVAYNFELSATSVASSLTGTAAVEVRVRTGPTLSAIGVQQSADDASLYHLEVSAFSEFADAEPFLYRFSYRLADASVVGGAGGEVVVAGFNFASFADVYLLPGSYVLRATVRDSFDAVSEVSQTLFLPSTSGECDLSSIFNTLEAAIAQQQVVRSLQLVNLLAQILFQSEYDACRRDDLVALLYEILEDFNANRLFLPVHAQQLASALLWLTIPQLDIGAEFVAAAVDLTDELLLFADGFVAVNRLPEASAITAAVGPIIDNLLDNSDVTDCDVIQRIRAQLQHLFELDLGPLLAGENADVLSASSIVGGVVRSDITEQGVNLFGGGESLSFNASITLPSATAGTVALVIVTLDTRDCACFADANGHCPLGSITNIETDRTIASVEFTLEYDAFEASDVCGERRDLKCSFYNEDTNLWDTAGCERLNTTTFADGSGQLLCRCNHLTTFAVIRTLRGENCGENALGAAPIFAFAGLYAIVGIYAAFQARNLFKIHRVKRTHAKSSNVLMAAQSDVLVVALCVSQISWLGFLFVGGVHVVVISFFLSLGRVLMYWIFAITIYQWAAIAFTQLSRSRGDVLRTKVVVCVGVVLVTLTLVAMAIGFALTDVGSDMFTRIEQAGTITLCFFNVVSLVSFLIVGKTLVNKITVASEKAGLKSKSTTKAAERIFRITLAFCFVFICETALTLLTDFSASLFEQYFVELQSLYLALDLCALLIVLFIFRSMISAHNRLTRSQQQLSQRNNTMPQTEGYSVQMTKQGSSSSGFAVGGAPYKTHGSSMKDLNGGGGSARQLSKISTFYSSGEDSRRTTPPSDSDRALISSRMLTKNSTATSFRGGGFEHSAASSFRGDSAPSSFRSGGGFEQSTASSASPKMRPQKINLPQSVAEEDSVTTVNTVSKLPSPSRRYSASEATVTDSEDESYDRSSDGHSV